MKILKGIIRPIFRRIPESKRFSIPASSSGTAAVTLRSSWLFGYDVYLDGKYIGTG